MVLDEEIHALYPFSHRHLTFEHCSKKLNLHYVDEGEGEPVLMLHGNPTWSFYFRNMISELKKTHRAIAVDHIGSGLSSKPQDYSYLLEDHIRNLNRLVEHLNLKKITLLVHDWGGAIGLGWAVRNLERIKKIIITNTAAFPSQDIPKRIAILKTPFLGEKAIRSLNLFAWPATFMATSKGLSPAVKKGLLAPYTSPKDRVGIAKFVKDIPLNLTHPSYKSLESIGKQLQNVCCPILILWGMKDFCFHEKFLKKWISIYPHAKVEKFAQAGHYLFEDEPKATLSQIQQFLG